MERVFLKLSYKGTKFFGWQIQPNETSIQACIEEALCKLNGEKEIKITGCGRTDTGVHASQYFAHFDHDFPFSIEDLRFKLNNMLPTDIAIQSIIPVDKDAHARFDAIQRTYHYFIHNEKDPFIHEVSWLWRIDLDIDMMNKACLILTQHSDFECFSKVKTTVTNFECIIHNALWIKTDKGYVFSISANRFLRNMVRAIVGTMLEIGEGKLDLEEFQKILDSKNRSEAGQSVPAKGLFLAGIEYPRSVFI